MDIFQKRRIRRKWINKWGNFQVYIRSEEENAFYNAPEIIKKLIDNNKKISYLLTTVQRFLNEEEFS